MKFPYIKVLDFPKHQVRERILPWIRFGIFNPKEKSKILYPLGLVDSGSDVTIIDHEFADELGFEIKKGSKSKISGVGGGQIDVYFHRIGFLVHDDSKKEPLEYKDWAAFTLKRFPSSMPQQTAILGTVGFFKHLDVAFKYPQSIVIEAKSR